MKYLDKYLFNFNICCYYPLHIANSYTYLASYSHILVTVFSGSFQVPFVVLNNLLGVLVKKVKSGQCQIPSRYGEQNENSLPT